MKKNIRTLLTTLLVAGIVMNFTASCSKNDNTNEPIPTGTVTDIDGNEYNTITIGKQVWMIENLKTTHYNNGDLIKTTDPFNLNIVSETKSKYQWAYDGDEKNVTIYGRLYTWYAATDERCLCPEGYHIPTNEEWTTLINYLGGENVAIHKLVEKGTTHWILLNEKATNASGFSALPAGGRSITGFYSGIGWSTEWWTSSLIEYEHYTWDITYIKLFLMFRKVEYVDPTQAINGNSVRCIKD